MRQNAIRRLALLASLTLNLGFSAGAHAALEGRDLDGDLATFEAYYDTVLDITWLADAHYAQTSGYDADGKMNWTAANAWADQLNLYGYDDWRLPTVEPVNGISYNYTPRNDGSTDWGYNITSPNSELGYMYYVNLGNPGKRTPSGGSTGCYLSPTDTCLNNTGPFVNLPNNDESGYWSSTEDEIHTGYAWIFNYKGGFQRVRVQVGSHHAWAVHPGDIGIAPIP
jgi:hypothetical protein